MSYSNLHVEYPIDFDDESTIPPSYCPTLWDGERSLDHTPNGIFTREFGPFRLTLTSQEDNASTPVYRQLGVIAGSIVSNTKKITDVTVKLLCSVKSKTPGRNGKSVIIDTPGIVTRNEQSNVPEQSSFSFTLPLPLTFDCDGKVLDIPPSYEVQNARIGIKCRYELVLAIVQSSLIKNTKSVRVPIIYLPRKRPASPIPRLDMFLSDSPEWYDASALITTRRLSNSELQPVTCHFYIPAVRTFSFQDVIPYHIRLVGARDSMDRLITPQSIKNFQVTLLRRTTVNAQGTHVQEQQQLGRGTIRVVHDDQKEGDTMEWEGEVRCSDPSALVGMFNSGSAWIQDFIRFQLLPDNWWSSPFITIMKHVAIRFTTDAYVNATSEAWVSAV